VEERLKKIKLLILDVDGVLTDGRIIFDSNGIESKFFNVKDGHGIKMLQRCGIEVGIISGRESVVVTNRAIELGIGQVYQKSLDKMVPYRQMLEATGLTDEEVAFMGDDVIEIPRLPMPSPRFCPSPISFRGIAVAGVPCARFATCS